MTQSLPVRRATPLVALPARLVGPMVCAAATGTAALLVAYMGLWSLVLLLYLTAVALAVLSPTKAAAALLFTAIVIEPGAVDFTRPLSLAVWQMPSGFENAVPFTTSPFELVTFAAATSAFFRFKSKIQTPLLAWGVPAAVALGFAYGLYHGGASNLAYNEARGIVAGIAIFILTSRVLPNDVRKSLKLTLSAMVILAGITIVRYLTMARTGNFDVPAEFLFSHEGSVILGIGLMVGVLAIASIDTDSMTKLSLVAYCLLISVAMVATGRRAATLVLLIGGLSIATLLFSVRPKTVLVSGLIIGVLGTGYMTTYWNKEYGAAAQPARAVRSQISPSQRDQSSDIYRTIEKYNVVETIRLNPTFGVGFGRPFYQFQPLTDMTAWWPLQYYTPHQSVLWLWLKMGLIGISIFLGFALLLLQRCLTTMRHYPNDLEWSVAALAFTGLLMFLIYATVDVGFAGPRALAPAAVLAAVALRIRRSTEEVDTQ